jgi:putative flippase GtrA
VSEAPVWPEVTVHRDRHRALLIQFSQFCLVGAFSTVLNLLLFNAFWTWGLGINGAHVAAFTLAVTNGFFLNRAWTFRRSATGKMERQYAMFFAVNLVGLGLTWVIMRLVGAWILHADLATSLAASVQRFTGGRPANDHLAYTLGELAATPFCAVWNFGANKLWTFGGGRR